MRGSACLCLCLAVLCLAPAVPAASGPALHAATSVAGTISVTSTADTGPGTLRRALELVESGDTITFDPAVFPPAAPATIAIVQELPHLYGGNVTIDASDAGVILDGSGAPGEWQAALQIVNSSGNAIRGLQITNFTGPAIAISGYSQHNVIGGDRGIGDGPVGQGNLLTRNDTGVVLSSEHTSLNTVSGNLIGTDGTGVAGLGNKEGVWICQGAHDNTIGPDNVIAYNWTYGIELNDLNTLRNTITQNSIHDNGRSGIRGTMANAGQIPPTIFRFDLQAGTVTGTACSGCTVEIFSDSEDEGAIFEGQVAANDAGVFDLVKGAALAGPHLTATTTDRDGNTSQFSVPTEGSGRSLTLQRGNVSSPTHLQHRNSRELLDNGIGATIGGWGFVDLYPDVDQLLYDAGVKWAHVSIHAQEPEYVHWDKPELSMSPVHDAVFTRMAENGLKLKFLLTFWDKATYPGGEGAPCARFKTEGEIERYLEYVRFIVRHFKDRIQYYELWNEPDIAHYCPKWIEVEDYINLVKRTVPVIREEYPEAKVVVGAVSSLRHPGAYGHPIGAHEYLLALLQSDIMPLVDAISWHPFYSESPDFEETRDYYYAYPAMVQQIKDVAAAHGFHGEYQVGELRWWTTENAQPEQFPVHSPTVAAKYWGRAILMHRGMGMRVDGLGGSGSLGYNLCTSMSGVEPAPLPVQIETTVTNTVSYTFSGPYGDSLVALWTNGVAADYDPGVPMTVTIPGFGGHTVTGVDALHGFEQRLTAGEVGEDLIIRALLVKDYPILLRLSPTRSTYLPVVVNAAP